MRRMTVWKYKKDKLETSFPYPSFSQFKYIPILGSMAFKYSKFEPTKVITRKDNKIKIDLFINL